MARTGGDGHRGDARSPGGEPEPAELWITSGPADAGPDAPHGVGAGPGGPPAPGGAPPIAGHGHDGGPRRTRWIALATGAAVLVAVIAVQHFAGNPRAGSTTTTAPITAATTGAPTPAAPTGGAAGSSVAQSSSAESSGSVANAGTPADMMQSALSSRGMVVATSAPGDGPDATSPETTPTTDTTSTADTTSPITTSVPAHALPGESNWELVGYGPQGLVRYQPATGKVVVTPVPALTNSDGPLTLVVTRSAAIIMPTNSPVGFLVPDGEPATVLSSALLDGGSALPGPGDDQVWVPERFDGTQTSLELVDRNGKPTGTTIRLPAALSPSGPYSVTPDGQGYVLATGVGGTYDVRPDGVKLVTHGALLAVGPTAFVVYECDDAARCVARAVDRATGKRTDLPKFTPTIGFPMLGVVSANGRYAATLDFAGGAPHLVLIDLVTGAVRLPAIAVNLSMFTGNATTLLAFSPDGRYLLSALDSSTAVIPIDTGTGRVLDPLPIPRMSDIAVRAGS